jgi:hypothetical protein
MQSKKRSLIEVAANLAAGIVISWLLTFYALPAFGLRPSVSEAGVITLIYTLASTVRQYALRRLFNRKSRLNG